MVNNSKQNWTIGNLVKIGFMTLKILEIQIVKDNLPDIYILENPKNNKKYSFIPHNGLTAL